MYRIFFQHGLKYILSRLTRTKKLHSFPSRLSQFPPPSYTSQEEVMRLISSASKLIVAAVSNTGHATLIIKEVTEHFPLLHLNNKFPINCNDKGSDFAL